MTLSIREAKFADLPAADAAPTPALGAIGVIGIGDDMESDMGVIATGRWSVEAYL
jgi:hypothetical protein